MFSSPDATPWSQGDLAALHWGTRFGVPWVELNVYEFNSEARRFYEALGYLPYSLKLRKLGPNAG